MARSYINGLLGYRVIDVDVEVALTHATLPEPDQPAAERFMEVVRQAEQQIEREVFANQRATTRWIAAQEPQYLIAPGGGVFAVDDDGVRVGELIGVAFNPPPTPKAQKRAMDLLRSWLSAEQLVHLDKLRYFYVKGSRGGRYRIHAFVPYNIVNDDEVRFCFAPMGDLPLGDVMLAQKLALEHDEKGALRVANVRAGTDWTFPFTPGEERPPRQPGP